MKTKIFVPILAVLTWGCLVPLISRGQGVLLSNFGSASGGSYGAASNEWVAQSFETGTNEYVLNTIEIVASIQGNPSGFGISLCSDNNGLPGATLGALDGNPPNSIYYATNSYTPLAPMTLSPTNVYWILLTAALPAASGNFYDWEFVGDTNYYSRDNWTIKSGAVSFAQGSDWTPAGLTFLIAVNATPVPEPGMGEIAALGLVIIFLRRRRPS